MTIMADDLQNKSVTFKRYTEALQMAVQHERQARDHEVCLSMEYCPLCMSSHQGACSEFESGCFLMSSFDCVGQGIGK